MGILAPLMLFGALAVGVPIALHFFYKARHRPLPWAAMEFLRQSIEQTSRRLKFQELILLALRCLTLILLALALARFSFSTGARSGRGESVAAVFVFDTTYSMGAKDQDKNRLDRAKEAALSIIDSLPRNSSVQIYMCTDRATPLPFTPTNLDQARNVVRGIELTSQTGDMLPGLTEGDAALDRAEGTNKELYIFSDLQKNGWERQAAALKEKAKEIQKRATLVIVRCGNPERPVNNVLVTDIIFPGGIPHTNTRLPFTVLLKNTGRDPVLNIGVTLEVDGQLQTVDSGLAARIEPGQTFPVTLTGLLSKAGPNLLTAKIGEGNKDAAIPGQPAPASTPDDLPGDNRFDKIILVRDRVRVLLIDGNRDPRDPKDSAGHFIKNALVPVPEINRPDYFIRVTDVTPNEATPALLNDADLCILANVSARDSDRNGIPGLSQAFADRLAKFVSEGHGLIIGAGEFTMPKGYNEVFKPLGLLPFDLTAVDTTKPEIPFKPAPDTTESPSFLSRLREEPYATVTADADVWSYIGTNEATTPNPGRVVLRLDNGKPILVAKALGEGEVLMLLTSLDAKWTNWPSKAGSYLSIVQMVLSHFTGRVPVGTNLVAGETFAWSPPEANRTIDLLRPNKSRTKIGKAVVAADGTKPGVTATDAFTAGVYQMGYEDESAPTGPRFAVNPDQRESYDLDSMTDDAVTNAVGFKPMMVTAGNEADSLVGNERDRRELTVYILMLLLLVAGAETAWAWKCGRAK